MQSMGIKASISRVHLERGKYYLFIQMIWLWSNIVTRFGWVNASYAYGLEFLNAHMRRALGAITPYETYIKAIKEQNEEVF